MKLKNIFKRTGACSLAGRSYQEPYCVLLRRPKRTQRELPIAYSLGGSTSISHFTKKSQRLRII